MDDDEGLYYDEPDDLESPEDDMPVCEFVGHCPCWHDGEECCNCGECGDDEEDY